MTRRVGRFAGALALLALLTMASTACGSAAELPLPGRGVDGETYTLTAVFTDALNLPDGAHVKVAGEPVGRVQRVQARDFTAVVTMAVRADVRLPTATTAELRQPTPLGDVFVELAPPAAPRPGTLRDGDTIGPADTSTAATVEDLLAAASTLVNGGGLAQTQTIVRELNSALDGRGEQVGHLLGRMRELLATLNARTAEIDRILAAAGRLSATARARAATVDAAFADLTPGIAVLAQRTDDLADALTAAGRLSATGDRVLTEAGPDIRTALHELETVLDGFVATDAVLGPSLRSLVRLGKAFEQRGEGEALATEGHSDLLDGVESVEGLGDPGNAEALERSFTRNMERLLRELGREPR
jgi:virulence factor Mce-like protein